ncbi:MAG: enoyl-CoA hydratase [Rhodospirillaceae bacterium]
MKLNTEKMIAAKADGIGWMTFNNPERRNATSLEMWEAVGVILDDFEADETVRVVVMNGAGGKAFVSGADISEFKEKRNDAEAAAEYAAVSEGARTRMATMQKPLIAMIDGYCLGGGLAIAMNADMRFASVGSQFGVPAARLGIAYAFNSLRRLVALVGPAVASEMMFTANRLSAERALEVGLINGVFAVDELEGAVREIATTIVNNAPLSVHASKATIGEILKDPADRDLDRLAEISKACFDSADYAEGRQAFMEKRPPVFTGT